MSPGAPLGEAAFEIEVLIPMQEVTMPQAAVLLDSSDATLYPILRDTLGGVRNLEAAPVAGPEEAWDFIDRPEVCLAIFHLAGDSHDLIARWLREVAARRRMIATIVIDDRYRADRALALLRLGVAEYLHRPLDLGRLAYLIDVLTVRARLAGPYPAATPAPDPGGPPIVREEVNGEAFLYVTTNAMGRLMDQVRRVAPKEATILLGGETGTGKTRLARLIHDLSPRRTSPFLSINCGALSATLIESEMFGHVRGAFTGADRDRVGKFAEVGRGTLFLDEIDSLPPPLQAKLLRAVEERIFEPVGSNESQVLRARLVAASNRVLEDEVAAGRFRADLYYRLNVVSFTVPPLRQRREVISTLARTFAEEFSALAGRPAPAIDPGVVRALTAFDWPGNIRELRNVIERAVALCHDDVLGPDDLPDALRASAAPAPLPAPTAGAPTLSHAKDQAERARIEEVLLKHTNNRLRAAAELGISRMTLYKKLHKYGLMSAF